MRNLSRLYQQFLKTPTNSFLYGDIGGERNCFGCRRREADVKFHKEFKVSREGLGVQVVKGNQCGDNDDSAIQRSRQAQGKLERGVKSLRQLAASLDGAVKTLEFPEVPSLESGVDFYAEVRRFEIEMIARALAQTGWIQIKAAAILKMNTTTLNSKIKHYKIRQNNPNANNKFLQR